MASVILLKRKNYCDNIPLFLDKAPRFVRSESSNFQLSRQGVRMQCLAFGELPLTTTWYDTNKFFVFYFKTNT